MKVWQLALVTYFTAVQPPNAYDQAIGMTRYEEEINGEIISLRSIVRSCYMCPIAETERGYYLNDLIAGDVDLYLRVKEDNIL